MFGPKSITQLNLIGGFVGSLEMPLEIEGTRLGPRKIKINTVSSTQIKEF